MTGSLQLCCIKYFSFFLWPSCAIRIASTRMVIGGGFCVKENYFLLLIFFSSFFRFERRGSLNCAKFYNEIHNKYVRNLFNNFIESYRLFHSCIEKKEREKLKLYCYVLIKSMNFCRCFNIFLYFLLRN